MGRANTENDFWERTKWDGDCLIWTGGEKTKGYGNFCYKRKCWRTHRLAYTFIYGSIPKGKNICHECDNRMCVNPKHLWLGSHQDNVTDRCEKGRSASKLSQKQVKEIYRLGKGGLLSANKLAAKFKVSASAVLRIIRGEGWKHVTGG